MQASWQPDLGIPFGYLASFLSANPDSWPSVGPGNNDGHRIVISARAG
jgi:hypothetical protein